MQNKIKIEGDVGQVVAGNVPREGAATNNHMSNVITIHPPDSPPTGINQDRDACARCQAVLLQLTRTRRWFAATCVLAIVAAGGVMLAVLASNTSLGVCHHESKVFSLGSVARMADDLFYVCAQSAVRGGAQWQAANAMRQWSITDRSPASRLP